LGHLDSGALTPVKETSQFPKSQLLANQGDAKQLLLLLFRYKQIDISKVLLLVPLLYGLADRLGNDRLFVIGKVLFPLVLGTLRLITTYVNRPPTWATWHRTHQALHFVKTVILTLVIFKIS
jgi:hypothetical protein